MPFKNREYRLVYRRKWYKENAESEKAHVKRRKKAIRRWLHNYKMTLSCSVCKESHPATIDFHHKQGNKEKAISQMITDGYSIEKIKEELTKCEVLCSNCHRKKHCQIPKQ